MPTTPEPAQPPRQDEHAAPSPATRMAVAALEAELGLEPEPHQPKLTAPADQLSEPPRTD